MHCTAQSCALETHATRENATKSRYGTGCAAKDNGKSNVLHEEANAIVGNLGTTREREQSITLVQSGESICGEQIMARKAEKEMEAMRRNVPVGPLEDRIRATKLREIKCNYPNLS